MAQPEALLAVRDLRVEFRTAAGLTRAVNGVNFTLERGETLAILGESGSGKSVSAQAIMGIVDSPPGRIAGGSVLLQGEDLLQLDAEAMRKVRGHRIAMIFQDAQAALDPAFTVGQQISETLRSGGALSPQEADARAVDLLERVKIPEARRRVHDYPHQFSGGMAQRVMIALALALEPEVLIADEPTTALDVTVQAQVMHLLSDLQAESGMGLILITHDLGVVAEVADRVAVMYAGVVVETGPIAPLYARPGHPYTVGLMDSMPRVDRQEGRLLAIRGSPPNLMRIPAGCAFHPRCALAQDRCSQETPALLPLPEEPARHSACHFVADIPGRRRSEPGAAVARNGAAGEEPLLRVEGLVKHFPLRSRSLLRRSPGAVRAVDGVDFELHRGETLGLVGESGCGKSTVARTLLRLERATAGRAWFAGEDLFALRGEALRKMRQHIQMVFQDPYSSLNPRMTAGAIVSEPWEVHEGLAPRAEWRARARDLLRRVGLDPDDERRYPHEFSGGQRQRIGIARALAFNPQLIICDEPVSALDVSIQAQIVNLLQDLQREFGIAVIFIAHDLSVVRHISDRVAVMYMGRIVETGTRDQIYNQPTHPYTQALLSAVPVPDPESEARQRRIILEGEVPGALEPPSGCRFRTRCWKAEPRCAQETPALIDRFDHGHPSACHFAEARAPAPLEG